MHIEAVPEPGEEWDAFATATPRARLGHAAAWAGVLRRAYGFETHYLAARDDGGALAGVLPLVCFRDLGGARELISLPFLDAAGILARDAQAERALLDAALALSRELRVKTLDLRQGEALAGPPVPPQERVDLVLALQPDDTAQWKALPAKVRNQTRKAEREGLKLAEESPGLAKQFYGPFAANMRDLGSPPHSTRFFAAAAEAFGERLRFVVTRHGDRPVGGLVAIDYAGAVSAPWASTLRAERHRCPNNLIYWEALRWAIGRGAREFDFGRSPREAGTYRFKRGWGALERELAWLRLDPQGAPLERGHAADSPLLRRLAALWTRLPVPLATALGARLRPYVSS